ncbi:MAG: hypothetical protein JXA69_08260 [Phycisphaerae bacterium]|nr:hypothetical protein [Phycisphaerae bacterium]
MVTRFMSICVVLAITGATWANLSPPVTNVTASQRTDGSKKVDIRYNLADADFDADGDVDLADFSIFTACFNGPSRPPAAGCP